MLNCPWSYTYPAPHKHPRYLYSELSDDAKEVARTGWQEVWESGPEPIYLTDSEAQDACIDSGHSFDVNGEFAEFEFPCESKVGA